MTFRDRADAGTQLAQRLSGLRAADPIVVALPRGGVPVAHPIATELGSPLDVLAVRKLGAPHNPELGMGAIAEDGTGIIDEAMVRALGVGEAELRRILAREQAELRRRAALYRGDRPPLEVGGRTVIVVGCAARRSPARSRARRARGAGVRSRGG
jgi:predicted phosphoribosyltransferase